MCATCGRAKTMPRQAALELVAEEMRRRPGAACLDKLVGELVGEPEPTVDRKAEAAWERGRKRGGGES